MYLLPFKPLSYGQVVGEAGGSKVLQNSGTQYNATWRHNTEDHELTITGLSVN